MAAHVVDVTVAPHVADVTVAARFVDDIVAIHGVDIDDIYTRSWLSPVGRMESR